MALFTPAVSPAIVVKDIDLTGGVPNVQTSTGAIVGNFRWGPVGKRTRISNESELVDTFASPDTTNTIDYHNASYFLRYSQSLFVVREVDDNAVNAFARTFQLGATADSSSTPKILNHENFIAQQSALDSDGFVAIGRFPGALGNSISASICPDSAAFTNWAFKSNFDGPPTTSAYDSARDAQGSEVHVAIIDTNGEFTGTKGTVLETYPYVSVASNSKNADGSTNYIKDVINTRSEYLYLIGFDSDYSNRSAGTDLTPGTSKTYLAGLSTPQTINLSFGGVNSGALGKDEVAEGFDLFEDKEQVEVDFLIAPGMNTTSDQVTVVNDLVSTAQATRKDCVVVTSPARDDVVNVTNPATATTNITGTMTNFNKSSYLIVDGNYLKVYDKFNDQFIQIPAASSTAGLMAETDRNAAPWFSPAGARRGQYLGVTAIDYNPNKSQRDTLYKAGINPITNIAGQGITLFGDKTALGRPSAFDRINVRRLFLVLERAIARAAQNVLFEFNDEFTRAEFVNVIEPVLRDVKGRRGITDFRVVADETVNTPAVVDRNEFIANIFIKPARSINYVTLNFVAVRTGVEFEEVVGTV